jgi:cytochrome c
MPSLPRRRPWGKKQARPRTEWVGRPAGGRGYGVSVLARFDAGFTWDQSTFADFMQNPRTKVPGNKMAFAGMRDQSEIARLWAYLSHFNVDGSSK